MATPAPRITDRYREDRDRFDALSPDQKTAVLLAVAGGAGVLSRAVRS
ncbi:hypothetical protein [Sphingomonas beigongshangi]|nr:hypothetical protein [Sphingomonas beigongshangi]